MTTDKTEVIRHTPAYSVDSVMRGHLFMKECEHGGWISLEDYESLQSDRDQQYDMKVTAREQRDNITKKFEDLQAKNKWLVQVAQTMTNHFEACDRECIRLQAECESLRKDAERYQALREMHWHDSPLAVVENPKVAVRLGHYCPSGEQLDEVINKLIKERNQGN